jgi:hypothetical protein
MESGLQKPKRKPISGLTLLCKRYAGLSAVMCKPILGQDIYQSLCLVDSEVLRNRHLRVAANRYQQY